MANVHFIGIQAVMNAYTARGVPCWAMFDGKTMFTKGMGAEELKETLQSVAKFNSQAVYTLRVYEGVENESEVKERTESDGSFNFRLHELGNLGGVSGSIEQRLAAIEEKLGGGDDDDEKSVVDRIGDAVVGLIEQPDKLMQVIGMFRSGGLGAVAGMAGMMAGGGDPGDPGNNEARVVDDDQRLADAINSLADNDKRFVQRIEKLAELKATKPDMYNMLVSSLDTM